MESDMLLLALNTHPVISNPNRTDLKSAMHPEINKFVENLLSYFCIHGLVSSNSCACMF